MGASYQWSGNDRVGKGKLAITSSQAPQRVVYELEFIEPFPSIAETSIAITPEGEGVKVTWAMDGNNDFIGKAFSLFASVDDMVGGDFESGLANLRQAAEAQAKIVLARPALEVMPADPADEIPH